MYTKAQVINLGLSSIGASRISRIDPPETQLERFMAENYEAWKRSEIAKRRWVFALEEDYQLPLVAILPEGRRRYHYQLPAICLRPVRQRHTAWIQRRRLIHSDDAQLRVQLIVDVDETDFDALFVDVMAARVALESVEYVTQSNAKKADAFQMYKEKVDIAGQANAYIIGPEDIAQDDGDFPFLYERY